MAAEDGLPRWSEALSADARPGPGSPAPAEGAERVEDALAGASDRPAAAIDRCSSMKW